MDFLATTAAKDQSDSGGLVASGFQEWLDGRREKKGLFMEYMEFQAPADRYPEG